MSRTCSICCEIFNKTNHNEVSCMYCNFPACSSCCKTFILNENTQKCMNTTCGKEWTRKFMMDVFKNSFITGPLKEHRENILFDRERALLPATQPYAEAINQIKNNEKELLHTKYMIKGLVYRKNELIEIHRYIYLQNDFNTKNEERNIKIIIKKFNFRKHELIDRNRFLRLQPLDAVYVNTIQDVNTKQERRKFIKHCPVNECRGFLSSQWKCGLCETSTCPDCHNVIDKNKNDPHTCDPNNVESAKMLKAETKPCPKCASSIFKIDGCDQMWCTQCHTAFSWKNGTIEKNIHNPHYYDWLRSTQGSVPRDQNDILHNNCHDAVENNIIYTLSTILQDRFMDYNVGIDNIEIREKIRNIIYLITRLNRQIVHFQEVVIRDTNIDYEERNRNLRIKYLMNEITEDMFKSRLQQVDKRYSKRTEEMDVYRLLTSGSSDIINRFMHYLKNVEDTRYFKNTILNEIIPLIKYANECTADIHKTYKGKGIIFDKFLIEYKH
jgi:hypothetical protein